MGSIYYVRNFTKGFYYHIYNRGAFKNDIFYDKSDYQTFLEVLAYYLRFPTGKPLSKLNIDNLDIKKVTNFPEPIHFLVISIILGRRQLRVGYLHTK